jgi:hypothetical protein
VLPPFVGNTVRGALGVALKEQDSPAFEQAFKIEAAVAVPNPYVISVPYPFAMQCQPGATLPFSVTLFGDACGFADDFVAAAKDMCRGKLKDCVLDTHELEYDQVWSDVGAENIPSCQELLVKFVTPTEILSSKNAVRELTFSIFVDSLFGRIADIIDHYTEGEFVIPYALVARKPRVEAQYRVKPLRFQTSGQTIDGFIGTVRYAGDVKRYLPYIDLGSQIHVGKKTTRACGEYSFEI